jgi:hypothetical protein
MVSSLAIVSGRSAGDERLEARQAGRHGLPMRVRNAPPGTHPRPASYDEIGEFPLKFP